MTKTPKAVEEIAGEITDLKYEFYDSDLGKDTWIKMGDGLSNVVGEAIIKALQEERKQREEADQLVKIMTDQVQEGIRQVQASDSLFREQNAEVIALKKELEGANKKIDYLRTSTCCAYCGFESSIDLDASVVSEHIKTCKKHPMRTCEEGIKSLESKLSEAEAENKRLRECLKLLLDCGHELADGLQRHEDSEDVLDWLKLEHLAKKALAPQAGEKKDNGIITPREED